MKILLTNNHLVQPGGSETWTLAMARELAREHEVSVFAPFIGPFAKALPCRVEYEVRGEYDVAIVNHNSCLMEALRTSEVAMFTCHGVVPALEQPIPGADAYISISREIQSHLRKSGYESKVILNGIDCETFAPESEISERPKRLLSACHSRQAIDLLRNVCSYMGIEFDYIHQDKLTMSVADRMNWADIVVGLGRTAYEAMACGRAVLVMDIRGYMPPSMDGMVSRENIEELLKNNLSGRRYQMQPTEQNLVQILERYQQGMGEFNRQFALDRLNVSKTSQEYLSLAAEVAQAEAS